MPEAIRIAHSLPGRLRVRIPGLRRKRDALDVVASALAAVGGMERVTARVSTASLLCEYDPRRLPEDLLVELVRRASGAARIASADEHERPEPGRRARRAASEGAVVARAVARAFREMNEDLLASTDGRLDLGTVAAVSFVALGALEVATTRRLPAPPWFNLAWWAFRTFTELEQRALASEAGIREPATVPSKSKAKRATRRGGMKSEGVRHS